MNNTIEFISEGGGERIDKFLSLKMSDFTRSHIQKLTDDGYVTVNEVKVKPNYKIKSGDIISVTIPEPEKTDIAAENIPLDIVYED